MFSLSIVTCLYLSLLPLNPFSASLSSEEEVDYEYESGSAAYVTKAVGHSGTDMGSVAGIKIPAKRANEEGAKPIITSESIILIDNHSPH